MHVAIITAGGAGMFCGSCMHDNTWARALRAAGAEVSLIPTYTPIRVDEENISDKHIFLGGINVYLDYRSSIWRRLPHWMTRWLDQPWAIAMATRFSISSDARQLGELTITMLEGENGPQRREIGELVHFLTRELRPDVIVFSNALLAGILPSLRREFSGRVYCTLQGDDVFLEALAEPFRSQALELVRGLSADFDGFLVHSRYYRDFMAGYLGLPIEKFHQIPLGIDFTGHVGLPDVPPDGRFTIGYFARICPEKGLRELVEAFQRLHARHPHVELRAGGFLGQEHRNYFEEIRSAAAPLGPAFQYLGSPATHESKVEFLRSLDVLSVPTVYHEPKGLYVLEALANGVPVVQPEHGAFPELIEATGGGLLVASGNPDALADGLEQLVTDAERRLALARAGYDNVRRRFDPQAMAEATLEVFGNTESSKESE